MRRAKRRRRLGVAIGLSVVVIGLLAYPAQAALFLIFKTNSVREPGLVVNHTQGVGPPGSLVVAKTGGTGAMGHTKAMPAMLTPSGTLESLPKHINALSEVIPDPKIVRVGNLKADQEATGHLAFRVPSIRPRRYWLIVFCRECAKHSLGRNVLPIASFVVTPSALPVTGLSGTAITMSLGALTAMGIGFAAQAWAASHRSRCMDGSS